MIFANLNKILTKVIYIIFKISHIRNRLGKKTYSNENYNFY